jgi:mRNA interferase RelE/StbE
MDQEIFDLVPKKAALKFMGKQDEKTRRRLISAIEGLRKFPPEGDIKPMQKLNGFLRLRVGTFRIIFKMDYQEKIVYIETIENRGDAYK